MGTDFSSPLARSSSSRMQFSPFQNSALLNSQQVISHQTDKAASQGRLGLALRPLQPQEKREAGVDGGLVIEDVAGASARAGVQPGDLLVAVNGTPVTSIDQVRAAVAKAQKSVALLIQRDGDRIFVPVKLG